MKQKSRAQGKQKAWISAGGVVLLLACLFFADILNAGSLRQEWSKTNPEINLGHIFAGAINRRGKPTGFHSRPLGKDPKNARLKKIIAPVNASGVYTATVEVYDTKEKKWKEKFSTLFPDSMNRQQVIEVILHAWQYRKTGGQTKWEGPSGRGFPVQGYLNQRGNINTAYPLYRK